MPSHSEHSLQVKITQWVREYVSEPKHFFCVDRHHKTSALAHVREKARGIIAGTPDTFLLVPLLPAICIELKAKGRTVEPDSAQERVGFAIERAKHLWAVADTVSAYAHLLDYHGVKLNPNWMLAAKHADALLDAAAIRKQEKKTGAVSKRRFTDPRSTQAQLKRIAKIRASGIRI